MGEPSLEEVFTLKGNPLFNINEEKQAKRNLIDRNQPLATRMRPQTLSEVVGQTHLIGKGKILTSMIESNVLSSIILYGKPGIGKTSIASAISRDMNKPFEYVNASVHAKKELEEAAKLGGIHSPVIIMIDEFHRLTKPNQDFLLMKLEEGSIIVIGATTENPYMSINPALRSRSQIFELKSLSKEEVINKLQQALKDKARGLGDIDCTLEEGVLEHIAGFTNGDLRNALNSLELVVAASPEIDGVKKVSMEVLRMVLQQSQIDGDKDGDAHYNLLSAFQKSIRGSDVDASLHYLARLIKTGDLISINRRLLVIAYEDIGLANHELVGETLNAINSAERVGFPEAQIILSYITTRLALSPKSNATYKAIKLAMKALESGRNMDIPKSIHDTHYKGAKGLGKGEGYKYSHDYPFGLVQQQFIPEELSGDRYLRFRGEDDTPQVQSIYNKINSIIKPS